VGSELILITVLVVLIALIIAETPVGFSLAISGTLGIILLRDWSYAANTLASTPYSAIASYSFILIPMFVLMGMLVLQAGIAQDVYSAASRVFRGLPGGLGVATVAACAGFAAVTGSSVATVATIGRLSIEEMRKYGYSGRFAAGIVAAGGTLGVLIPPSLILVVYGILTGESIGRLLIAGIVPGVLSAVLYGGVVLSRVRKEITPPPDDFVIEAGSTVSWRSASAVLKVIILAGIVVGGIYSGYFTATESGAVAAMVALLMLLATASRRVGVGWAQLRQAFHETTSLSSMVFMLLLGGALFNFFIVSGGYARSFADWLTGFPVHPLAIVALLLLAMVPLGMLLDGLSILLLTIPIAYPVITGLGFDGIWFGILVVKMIELGLITPPVGINVYVVAGAAPDLTVEESFRGVIPFGMMDVLTTALLFAFPVLVTWLPALVEN
jgi:C4-dicarboxylate transporter, DctM subunit